MLLFPVGAVIRRLGLLRDMVIEAVDFMGMGASGDQHMADAEASAERKPSSSSPERDPDRGADPTPRSPAGSSARESEGPGEAETKGEEKRVKLEVEGQGEAKKARTSPPRSPGVASDKPPTTGIQVTEEEYRLFLQFRGMTSTQHGTCGSWGGWLVGVSGGMVCSRCVCS